MTLSKNFFVFLYKNILEKSINSSEFAFDSVNLLYHKFHKISLNRGESYVDFRKWLKNKKNQQ